MRAIRLLLRTLVDALLIVAIAAAVSGSILYFDQRKFIPDQDGRLAVLVGVRALGIPVPELDAAAQTRVRFAQLTCQEMPLDDSALEAWGREQPGAERVLVQRKDAKTVVLTYREPPPSQPFEKVPWEQLGYKSNERSYEGRVRLLQFVRDNREYLLLHLGCLQIGVAVVGLGRWGWNRWRRVPMAPLMAGSFRRALLIGAGAGVVLAALAWLYDAGLRNWVGPTSMTTRAWAGTRIDLLPWAQDLVWLTILFVGPLFQELYFRGVLFGSWLAAGLTLAGVIVSALLAALARLDWYHFPFALLLGVALAETYRRSRHLAAPLIAHSLTNLFLLGLLLGSVRGWPDASSRIVGVWVREGDPKQLTIEYRADGRVLTEEPSDTFFVFGEVAPTRGQSERRYTISRYEFVGRDHIRSRDSFLGIPIEIVERVSFEGDVMTVTLEESNGGGEGTVSRYRRVPKGTVRGE